MYHFQREFGGGIPFMSSVTGRTHTPYARSSPAARLSHQSIMDRHRAMEHHFYQQSPAYIRHDPVWFGDGFEDINSPLTRSPFHYGGYATPGAASRASYVMTSPPQPLKPIVFKANGDVTDYNHIYPAPSVSHYVTPQMHLHTTVAPAPVVHPTVFSSDRFDSESARRQRRKKALTYPQCEILNDSGDPELEPEQFESPPPSTSVTPRPANPQSPYAVKRQRSLQLPGRRGLTPSAEDGTRRSFAAERRAASVTPTGVRSPSFQPQERAQPEPLDSFVFDGTANSLEQLKALNEKNLALARNSHVRDIWRTLQTPTATPSNMRIADTEKAKEVLRQLNPQIQNSDALMQILMDHIQGKAPQINDELVAELSQAPGATKLYVPVNPRDAEAGPVDQPAESTDKQLPTQNGFKVSHAFAMKLKAGEEREFAVVKIIESPEVLAVFNLLTPSEADDLVTLVQDQFEPCKTSAMKVKVEEQATSYTVPNDLEDIPNAPLLDSAALHRQCSTCVINLEGRGDDPSWSFLKSIALRAAAVAKVPSSLVTSFYVERYVAGEQAMNLHPSNKRLGFVYICLNTAVQKEGCAISFPAAEIEVTPRTGMALYIPSCHPDTIPTSPTYDREYQYVPDLRTAFCVTGNATTDERPIYYAVIPIPFQ